MSVMPRYLGTIDSRAAKYCRAFESTAANVPLFAASSTTSCKSSALRRQRGRGDHCIGGSSNAKQRQDAQVVDEAIGHARDVEQPVDKVDRPVECRLDSVESEAVHAELEVELSVDIRGVANDSLARPVLTSPMTSPTGLVAVAVDVVASEQYARFVRVEEGVPDA